MAGRLNGRLARLEVVMRPETGHCRSCGRRHVQPVTLDVVRRIVGMTAWASPALQREIAQNPAPPLCLCDPCCGDPGDRMLANMSHGVDYRGGT